MDTLASPLVAMMTSIINAGPIAVISSLVAVVALLKLSRLSDIFLDRLAKRVESGC